MDILTCKYAANYGHLKILEWVHENDVDVMWDQTDLFANAADGGHSCIIQWLRTKNYQWDVFTCAHAARRGRIGLLQWLRAQNPPCPWNATTIRFALEKGHTSTAEWARANGCPEE
jgi:hypothetical protein